MYVFPSVHHFLRYGNVSRINGWKTSFQVQLRQSTQEGIVPLLLQSSCRTAGGVDVHTGQINDTPKAHLMTSLRRGNAISSD